MRLQFVVAILLSSLFVQRLSGAEIPRPINGQVRFETAEARRENLGGVEEWVLRISSYEQHWERREQTVYKNARPIQQLVQVPILSKQLRKRLVDDSLEIRTADGRPLPTEEAMQRLGVATRVVLFERELDPYYAELLAPSTIVLVEKNPGYWQRPSMQPGREMPKSATGYLPHPPSSTVPGRMRVPGANPVREP